MSAKIYTLSLLAAGALLATGCGSNSKPAPTAPVTNASGAQGGAAASASEAVAEGHRAA